MRICFILILFFSILSCEKNYDPLGGKGLILETSEETYVLGDSVKIYLIKESNISVFSHPPGEISKKIGDEWSTFERVHHLMFAPPPQELKNHRMLVLYHDFQDTGLFRYRLYFTWDKDRQVKDGLGYIISNAFRVVKGP